MPEQPSPPLVELRRYKLVPGMRERLVELFDRHFVDSQEACGMTVLGQFRDLDDPDRFTWMRGFPDMARRAAALTAFYGGQIWAEHRDAANATMIEFDDVHLLRPAGPGQGIAVAPARRADAGAAGPGGRGVVLAAIRPDGGEGGAAAARWLGAASQRVQEAGGSILGQYLTAEVVNDWPRLPVRTDRVVALLGRFETVEALDGAIAALRASMAAAGADASVDGVELARLVPTTRSALG